MSNLEVIKGLVLLGEVRLRSTFITHLASGGLATIITSRHLDPSTATPELLSIDFQAKRHLRTRELLEILQGKQNQPGLDIPYLRSQLSSSLARFLSRHLLESQKVYLREADPLKRLALSHSELVSWGETKAAKALAEYDSVPVRTIHTHLYLARQQGYQAFPGKGVRS